MSRDADDLPARTLALDAVIRVAVSKVGESSWHSRFDSATVQSRAEADVSTRTCRRALKDAETLGWVSKRQYGNDWQPGERAEEFQRQVGMEYAKRNPNLPDPPEE